MKKILFLLLCTVHFYGQTSNGSEQEFDYGIKNNSTQTITTPPYLTTTGMDGTQGKIPSALIEKTDNKQNSLTVDGTGTKYPTVDAVYDFVTANAVTLGTTNGLSLSGQQISLGLSSTSTIGALSSTDWNVFNNKQNNLVSGTSIKTLEGKSLLGSGNIDLVKADVGLSNVDNTSDANKPISTATQTALNGKENSFAKNTAFNKNFGTTAGTVVEGGTLGTNAYSSTAYLPTASVSGTTNYLPKFTGANSLGNSLIYDNGTKVGIGTTNPQVKLSVQGAQNNTIAPANGVAKFIGNDSGIFIGTLAGTPNYGSWLQAMRETDGLVLPMCLNPKGGNVLIGTTTDNGIDLVQVNGTISATGGTTANQVVVKSQLDGKVSLTGNETVAGNKTLSGTTTLNETIIREGYQLKFPKGVMYQSSVGTNALTDNRTVSFPDASGTVALVETVRPYKVYTALLSQSGTSAPTATVLENTLGGTVVWTRSGIGSYQATLTGSVYTSSKTVVFATIGLNKNLVINGARVSDSVVSIMAGTGELDSTNMSIEIKVYN